MKIPKSADDFIMLRRGLLEHIIQGRMKSNELDIFIYMLIKANKKTGILYSNATIISSELRVSRKYAQHGLYNLRESKYIYYPDTRGIKGPHEIFINKYPVQMEKNNPWPNPVWFSSIWDENGKFLGREIFLAEIKVRNLPSIWHIKRGICEGLWISGFGLCSDFVLDFTRDFEEYQKNLYILRSSIDFCKWLSDFEGAFERDFAGTFNGKTYYILILKQEDILSISNINIPKDNIFEYIYKKHEALKKNDTEDFIIMELCTQLKDLNHGFDPILEDQKSKRKGISFRVRKHILTQMVKHKINIDNAYAYYHKILFEEQRQYKHEEFKKIDGKEILRNLNFIDRECDVKF